MVRIFVKGAPTGVVMNHNSLPLRFTVENGFELESESDERGVKLSGG
jgi:hypothetical protein